ncbi:MAG: TetR/AcrR family transcriptional regulator [Pseudomonadota bacterium]
MSKKQTIPTGSAPERIMTVATELFYKQGYRATGINEVIEKSGVAKATFYNHFPTKDDLGLAYLKSIREIELAYLDSCISQAKGPLARVLAVIESLEPWLIQTNYRGCGFINMAAEVPEPRSPLRKEGKLLYDRIRARVEELAEELIASDKKKYGHHTSKALTEEYMVIFAGAVFLAEIYHAVWPVEHARQAARRLLG